MCAVAATTFNAMLLRFIRLAVLPARIMTVPMLLPHLEISSNSFS